MTEPMSGGRRRIDRVLSEEFLAGIQAADLDEVRDLRREAEQEEADLSYIRRLVQGRADIVQAEIDRRSGKGGGSLIERLSEILADDMRSTRGSGRHITVEPSRIAENRRSVERIVSDAIMSDVVSRSDEELTESLGLLREHEQQVSRLRRRVQEVVDACSSEISRRYSEGTALPGQALRVD
jgi:hypothetical protein